LEASVKQRQLKVSSRAIGEEYFMQKHFTIWIALLLIVVGQCPFGAVVSRTQSAKTGQVALTYRFTSGSSTRGIPFEFNLNKPYLRARINDAGPYWFLLDNGASFNVVDAARAKELGIALSGGSEERGAGEGTITSTVGAGVSLRLPGLELLKQNVTVIPLSSAISPSEGRMVDGLLGYDFFKQFVVEIDYARQRINIYDPQIYNYAGQGQSIPLVIDREHAFISTTLVLPRGRRIPGKFMIDTGWRSALTLNAPFVETQKLIAILPKSVEAVTGWGVGGPTIDTVGRVESLQLGRYTLKNFVANFSKAKGGVLAESGFTGIIGGEILRRFKVIFDYPHHRMILEPNAHFADPFGFDMSGLFIRAEGQDFKTFKVYGVIKNSPGFKSGLREGDVIEAINERPGAEFTLEQVRQVFRRGVGKEYLLSVRRGEQRLKLKMKLRRLI
jgi:hypothetical protein